MRHEAASAKQDIRRPLFARIAEDLRARVRSGQFAPGSMLPGRRALADEYGVDVNTVQRAMALLIEEKLLRADAGRGTFVAESVSPPEPVSTQALQNNVVRSQRIEAVLQILTPERVDSEALAQSAYRLQQGYEDIPSFASPEHWGHFYHGFAWFGGIVSALERTFCARGGRTTHATFPTLLDHSRIREAALAAAERGVDAIAVVSPDEYPFLAEEVVALARELAPLPVVMVAWEAMPPPLVHVFYDQEYAGYRAAQHLIEMGYERIIALAPYQMHWTEQRLQGVRMAVRHANWATDRLRIYPEGDIPPPSAAVPSGYELAQRLAKDGIPLPPDSAIIAPNDGYAAGMLRYLNEQGRTVGHDIGLIGFDDDPRSRILEISTLRPPLEAMGEEAGRMLLDALTGSPVRHQVRLYSHLIARASTYRG